MAIRFETGDGKVRTVGGGDPKLKSPIAPKPVTQRIDSSFVSKSSDADYARLSARVDALELLVTGLANKIARLKETIESDRSVTSNVTHNANTVTPVTSVTDGDVTRNANSNAERQRRYRERQRAKP
jgi:hypothetical protein